MYNWLARSCFYLGARIRNPSLMQQYNLLKNSEFSSLETLKDLQLGRLKELLVFAGKHSPYYQDLFTETGFEPIDFNCFEDIKTLPIMSKSELISHNKLIHSDFPFSKLMLAETSGTSGVSLEFYRSEKWDSVNRANVMRAYDWFGVKVWDKNGYLWGYNIGASKSLKVKALDWLQNRQRIFRYDSSNIKKFAKNVSKASYIAGYSSMIYEVAKQLNNLSIKTDSILMVKGTSEMILDAYQPEIEKAFGRKMISEYGAAEAGLIAFECPDGSMHMNIESVYVEVDDNNEILITNLFSHSFPIIRYRLGDVVTLSDKKCTCGRNHPILTEIVGRKGANIAGKIKTYPALTFYYVFKNIYLEHGILLNYKAIQEAKGEVILHIEKEENSKFEQLIIHELKKYFSDDINCELKYINEFEVGLKKRQYFESNL